MKNLRTVFYFSDTSRLNDFEEFGVKPIYSNHFDFDDDILKSSTEPKSWAVIGTLRSEKAEGLEGREFPVADFPSELYASLFASLCKGFIQ